MLCQLVLPAFPLISPAIKPIFPGSALKPTFVSFSNYDHPLNPLMIPCLSSWILQNAFFTSKNLNIRPNIGFKTMLSCLSSDTYLGPTPRRSLYLISFRVICFFRSSVNDHQGRGSPPFIKWITDINTSITQGSCLFPDLVQSSSYSSNGSFPISFLG